MQDRQRHPIPKRATAEQLPFHRAGHSVNHHPEDAPYITAQKQHRSSNPLDLADDLDYPEERTRSRTSAVRYVTSSGQEVIQRGNKRFVIHDEPPPRKHHHWLLYIGVGMIFMLALYVGLQMFGNWWTEHQLDATYGFPRTYQVDAIVYPGDTSDHPSHYIFLNLNGTVEIIELPHSDSAHARIYKGPTIFSNDADLVPVTGEFKNVNGKVEMIVHIQDQVIVYINDGTQFKPQGGN